MVDAVSSQVLQDGERQYIAKFTNISDGTGESKVTKIDVSTLAPNSFGLACNGLKITKVVCQTYDMGVDLFWVGDPTPAGDHASGQLSVTMGKMGGTGSTFDLECTTAFSSHTLLR